jgi:hypothetical protein
MVAQPSALARAVRWRAEQTYDPVIVVESACSARKITCFPK